MLTIRYSARFKKDYKLVKKRGYDIGLLEEVLEIYALANSFRKNTVTTS